MASKVRDTALDTRTSRSKLKPHKNHYWRMLDKGTHLGYRRIAGKPGSWTLRTYVAGRPANPYDTVVIGIADDLSDANGADVLSFYQAQTKAREIRDQGSKTAHGIAGPYIVAKALEEYFMFLRGEGRPEHLVDETEQRGAALTEPKLGDVEVAKLTTKQLRAWRDSLVKTGARLRTRKGEEQQYREIDEDDDDAMRARRAS